MMPTIITNVEDLRRLAKRRVPRMFYDYADSGSWTESRRDIQDVIEGYWPRP